MKIGYNSEVQTRHNLTEDSTEIAYIIHSIFNIELTSPCANAVHFQSDVDCNTAEDEKRMSCSVNTSFETGRDFQSDC